MTSLVFLPYFTPSLMSREQLEDVFVEREGIVQRITELVRDSVLHASMHHTLLIGPRGIGKTHLISLVYHRVHAMDDLRDRLLTAWLHEEEWGVDSFLDLLVVILRALQAEGDDAALAARIETLYTLSPDDAESVAAALLKDYVGDRTLLLLMENLNDVFAGLGEHGQKQWRAYLQENAFTAIVATSQSLFDGVSSQTAPFYGFFVPTRLKGLTLEGAVELLAKIASLQQDEKLAAFVQTPEGQDRIQAAAHLAGNNPRIYVIFSQFLTYQSLDELIDPIMSTLNDLTPYYQARMSAISRQQRKIIDLLCECRSAVQVGEVAQRCFITPQTASSQLLKLAEWQYVHVIRVGRDSYYEIHEPLMRLSLDLKKERGSPIRLFVEFLRLWYSRGELEQRLEMLPSHAKIERIYLRETLTEKAEARPSRDNGVSTSPVAGAGEKILAGFDYSLKHNPERAWLWQQRGIVLEVLGRVEEALTSYDRALKLDPVHALEWRDCGAALGQLGQAEESLSSFDDALERNPTNLWAVLYQGLAFESLGRNEEALASYERALELDAKDAGTWHNRGNVLNEMGRNEEALASYDRALELDVKDPDTWYNRGNVLNEMGRNEEALASYDRAAALGIEFKYTYSKRARLLIALDRWSEGMSALEDALARFQKESATDDDLDRFAVRHLSQGNAAYWPERIAELVLLYEKHGILAPLGQGLVAAIDAVVSPQVSPASATEWLRLWREAAKDFPALALPLRLLHAAVQYRETNDPRPLLALPFEERSILLAALPPEYRTTLEERLSIEPPTGRKKGNGSRGRR